LTAPFHHLIMTRFNVRPCAAAAAPDDLWLRHRLELFCRFTLPSLRAQTVKAFRWLVLVDSASPAWFLTELAESLGDERFEVVPTTVFSPGAIVERHFSLLRASGGYLITTRVDNDDAVARDFVASIQLSFSAQPWEFVNLINGAQFCGGRVYAKSDPANPFISLVEHVRPHSTPCTVFVCQHEQIRSHGPVRQVKTHPMWLQVIHERNVANRVRGIRVEPQTILRHFNVDAQGGDHGQGNLLWGQMLDVGGLVLTILRRPASAAKAWRIARTLVLARWDTARRR
jgi:hypothetical protein